ncbi:hypothetical protein [Lysinibacillus piscis]|uniref:Uncharacterized protein n=1 Tax=Lysinibacillus piscis TaxID=2518931 RepID=A0ABQ5NLX4_9BACI|nr:hypothetical protein [Lysinibacillus sp. KH24]GLC89356.1 hypothetical protein LYSBPC_24830 [Lysinibacillus sp. KH24]
MSTCAQYNKEYEIEDSSAEESDRFCKDDCELKYYEELAEELGDWD